MSEKNFFTISTEGCQTEYKAIIVNSDRKLRSAEILAKDQDYGSAISLLIISNEELIKALFLFLDGQGFEFRKVKGIKSLFNNHRLRYLLAMIFSILAIFGDDLKKMLVETHKNPQLIREMINNKSDMEKKLQLYLIVKVSEIQKEINFFSQVDTARQFGLYKDGPKNHQFTETDYFRFLAKVCKIKQVITHLIEGFQMEESKELAEKLMKQFKYDGWNNKLANLIKKINRPRADSYKHFSELLNEFGQSFIEYSDNEFRKK